MTLDELKTTLAARWKSLLWRLGCVMAIAGLNWLQEQLSGFGLPPWAITGLGLVLGEATKWVTNHTNLLGAKKK